MCQIQNQRNQEIEWHSINDAIPRAHEFTNRLTKELGLNDSTSKKVYDTYLANTKSLDEIKMGVADERSMSN
jgi:hypothetical protein